LIARQAHVTRPDTPLQQQALRAMIGHLYIFN